MKQRPLLYTLFLVSFAISACQPSDPNAAIEAKNKETMKAIMSACGNHQLDALDNLIATDFMEHTPDPWMKSKGLAGLKESLQASMTMMPDFTITVNWMIAEGDLVMAHYTWRGTNTGSVEGMPATGKAVNVDGVDVTRFKDGKGVEHWGYFDMAKMMEQLGMTMMPATAVPAPNAPAQN